MAFSWGDSWDCYASSADTITNYWDSNVGTIGNIAFVTGRFAGSQAVVFSANTALVKNSGVNDTVHHFVCAIRQTAAITGSTLGTYFQLLDGSTAQCSVVFRSDGAILLVNGIATGTVQATYTGAVTAVNTWYAFEIEVIIGNTTGRMRVRKNGNPVDDFDSGATFDTQNSANAYANKLQMGASGTIAQQQFDDVYWRSDASSVAWMGDIKCQARAPASDAAVQFSRSAAAQTITVTANTTASDPTNTSRYNTFVATYTGPVGSIIVNFNGAFTGNCKLSMFADVSGNVGAVLGSATTLVNPVTGNNTFTFVTPISVTKGVTYWFGISHDVTAVVSTLSGTSGKTATSVSYASFPTGSPTTVAGAAIGSVVFIGTTVNADFVSEPQQDATTSYVYDSVVGHADFYGIAPIASTPLTTFAVTTRAYMIKSDAGTRTAAVQLRSGGTTDASPTIVLTPSNWQWAWKHYTSDPAGGAWTAAAVNTALIGPAVIS